MSESPDIIKLRTFQHQITRLLSVNLHSQWQAGLNIKSIYPEFPVELLQANIQHIKDPAKYIRAGMMIMAGACGEKAVDEIPEVIEMLCEGLRDSEPYVRAEAACALGRIGPKAKAAIPALIEARKDLLSEITNGAHEAIIRISNATNDERQLLKS